MNKKAKGLCRKSEGNTRNQAAVEYSEKMLLLEQHRERVGKEIKETGEIISEMVAATSGSIKIGLKMVLINSAIECGINYVKQYDCKVRIKDLMKLMMCEEFIIPFIQKKVASEKSLFGDIAVLEHLIDTEFREALIEEIIEGFNRGYYEVEISEVDFDIESLLNDN